MTTAENLSLLNGFQKEIYQECLIKGSGGLSLLMGSGKTLISLVVALEQTKNLKENKIIIVCSKTLIQSWIFEIKKFFKEKLKVVVIDTKNSEGVTSFENYDLIIASPDTLLKYYREEKINTKFINHIEINRQQFGPQSIVEYKKVFKPLGTNLFYGIKFGSVIVDEAQNYTNIDTYRCQAICSLSTEYIWAMSGTLFDEPNMNRILGYHLMIKDYTFPRNISDTKIFVKSHSFRGLRRTMVYREKNEMFTNPPEVNIKIIEGELSPEEEKLYLTIQTTVDNIKRKYEMYKINNDTENTRKFGAYLMAVIGYLRQSVINPLIPISNIALDMTNINNESVLSEMLMEEIGKLGINGYFESKTSIYSTRIRSIIKTLNNHRQDNCIVYSCFRTCIDLFRVCIKNKLPDRKIFTISGDMSSPERQSVLDLFKIGKGNILLLTYTIGAEGLNLQEANTVLLADFYWNNGKIKQSIGRVLRYGQESKTVNVYYFTSNTGIENAILKKHDAKLVLLKELNDGAMTHTVKKMTMNEIVKIITSQENQKILHKLA